MNPALAGGYFTTSPTWEAQTFQLHLQMNLCKFNDLCNYYLVVAAKFWGGDFATGINRCVSFLSCIISWTPRNKCMPARETAFSVTMARRQHFFGLVLSVISVKSTCNWLCQIESDRDQSCSLCDWLTGKMSISREEQSGGYAQLMGSRAFSHIRFTSFYLC